MEIAGYWIRFRGNARVQPICHTGNRYIKKSAEGSTALGRIDAEPLAAPILPWR